MLLDYLEDQTERRRLVSQVDAEQKLEEWLKFNERPSLHGFGGVTAKAAEAHAKAEYTKFDAARRLERKRHADENLIRALDSQIKSLPAPVPRSKAKKRKD